MLAKPLKSAILRTGIAAALVGAAAIAKTVLSAPATPTTAEAAPTVAGWSELVDSLRDSVGAITQHSGAAPFHRIDEARRFSANGGALRLSSMPYQEIVAEVLA